MRMQQTLTLLSFDVRVIRDFTICSSFSVSPSLGELGGGGELMADASVAQEIISFAAKLNLEHEY